MTDEPITDTDGLYLRLKGARERLCQVQSSGLLRPAQIKGLDRAITEIDRVGAYVSLWSEFDLPTVLDPTEGDAK